MKMKVSYQSVNRNGYDARYYAKYYSVAEVDIEEIICRKVWSPNIWRGNHRLKENFLACNGIGIDIDEGLTIERALAFLEQNNLAHVLATTKSHQQWKVSGSKKSPPCDRFRIVLFAEQCQDAETVRYTNRKYIEHFGSDSSCQDEARFFFPCKEIISAKDGRKVSWIKKPNHILSDEQRAMVRRLQFQSYNRENSYPAWLSRILRDGVAEGGRHKACYSIANALFEYGFAKSADDAHRILSDSFFATIDSDEYLRRTCERAESRQRFQIGYKERRGNDRQAPE